MLYFVVVSSDVVLVPICLQLLLAYIISYIIEQHRHRICCFVDAVTECRIFSLELIIRS